MAVQEDLSSLKREIHILKRCKCDYVVEFIDCFFLDNELWIVMEFCLGGSVSDMLDATEKTLTEAQIRSVCACVALGLAYLHEQHNIHRCAPQTLFISHAHLVLCNPHVGPHVGPMLASHLLHYCM